MIDGASSSKRHVIAYERRSEARASHSVEVKNQLAKSSDVSRIRYWACRYEGMKRTEPVTIRSTLECISLQQCLQVSLPQICIQCTLGGIQNPRQPHRLCECERLWQEWN